MFPEQMKIQSVPFCHSFNFCLLWNMKLDLGSLVALLHYCASTIFTEAHPLRFDPESSERKIYPVPIRHSRAPGWSVYQQFQFSYWQYILSACIDYIVMFEACSSWHFLSYFYYTVNRGFFLKFYHVCLVLLCFIFSTGSCGWWKFCKYWCFYKLWL